MSKNMNCDCPAHPQTFCGGTKQNRGARDLSSLGRACLLHTVPLSFCHLLPRGTWPISKQRFCRSRCESSGWRLLWPPTASTGKQLRGGTELCQEKPDLPIRIPLPNHKGQEKSQALLPNTQQGYKMHTHIFHHCCFPRHKEKGFNYTQTLLTHEDS